jgi:hypothetical protein
VLSADTAAQIATKTMVALNSTYFAAPQLQGVFLRGYDPNKIWDLDADSRLGMSPIIYGNALGTFEIDEFISHNHLFTPFNSGAQAGSGGPTPQTPQNGVSQITSYSGGNENRSINYNVNWVIRY